MRSWRTASVSLLSFSSGLPLGMVWIAIPDWMRDVGVGIELVGLFTLAQAPWTFKMLWSPAMDRYVPPWLGRRRGWAALAQIALLILTLLLAGVGDHPDSPWIIFALALAIAFASASQDIAIDAYAVDVLRKDEQAVAVGARVALYRAAMMVAGGLSIWLAARFSWPLVNVMLASLFLPMLLVSWKAPEPRIEDATPQSFRDAVWLPFLGFLSRHRAVEILAFVFFYKLADNLAQALLRPFLNDMGYDAFDRGIATGLIGMLATIAGTFLGGGLTAFLGLGRCLWIFGLLQIFSNVGYLLLAHSEVNRPLMWGAMTFENLTQGLGTGAFSVLLLRMTQKRFSATQYALFSSLFGLPRIFSGPVAGFAVGAVGWSWFFWGTMVAGIPGMLLLARFVPFSVREPIFTVEPPRRREPLSVGGLTLRGAAGLVVGLAAGWLLAGLLAALRGLSAEPERGFQILGGLGRVLRPEAVVDWIQLGGVLVFGLIAGLFAAALAAARHGMGLADEEAGEEEGR
jgi:PAT family beta-lactamase induction signal transducer AmpG